MLLFTSENRDMLVRRGVEELVRVRVRLHWWEWPVTDRRDSV